MFDTAYHRCYEEVEVFPSGRTGLGEMEFARAAHAVQPEGKFADPAEYLDSLALAEQLRIIETIEEGEL